MKKIEDSELILNKDGSIFHLHLKPENISDTIILVGDQDRVDMISGFFNNIDFKTQNREFKTHTGTYKNKRISVISTGIGTDNIDIVVNELDAIVNIDLEKRVIKEKHTTLNYIRIGTSGALQEDIPVDTPVISKMAIGFDGLLNFYSNRNKVCNLEIEKKFKEHMNWNQNLPSPYFVDASDNLLNKIGKDMRKGLTISAPGFYGPQGRVLRLPLQDSEINNKIINFRYNSDKITNYEMESSAIFGLSKLLNHNAVTVCNIIANRLRKEYSKDYKKAVKNLVGIILDRIVC
ncbi:MAG: nucleoside phosphorylase [Bacteroidales bacterium]|nr:nucleoside phosphorylase [Bacteroidales bacterium]